MSSDLWSLCAFMLKSRLVEQAVARLWQEGLISGEMHLGTGEEAIVAGVVSHLGDGDALALDHRGTAALVMRGVDPVALLRELLVRFGPRRVWGTPVSESAFVGDGVTAAMSGFRPVVELYMVDFIGVCMNALLNEAAKLDGFAGGRWSAPLVVRAPCGGGHGDGGQHEQSLWGLLAHIPGLVVIVPSTPADAGGLMLAALEQEAPVVFLEHKLLSEQWLDFLGTGGRSRVQLPVPAAGVRGPVP